MYAHFARFFLPLVVAAVMPGLSKQFLSGGMARVPQATQVLAAFGLAWGLTDFLASPVWQVRQLGLVLVDGQGARRRVQRFTLATAMALCVPLGALALTPAGVWVIGDLHGVEPELLPVVREALVWLLPMPVVVAGIRLYSGLLVRARRTDVVSAATLLSIGSSIAAVFLLLPTSFVQSRPIRLPVAVMYAGILMEVAVTLWGYRRFVRPQLGDQPTRLTYGYITGFFWPLALVMAIQGFSRPLINLVVSRGVDSTEALATLAIVYPLGLLPYGWVNELRNLPTAFATVAASRHYIRRFTAGCGLLSFLISGVMFWTPLRQIILLDLIGLSRDLADLCYAPLGILPFFPLVVAVRAYVNGVALAEHRTRAMAPSAPARLGAIYAGLAVLGAMGMQGAVQGIGALLGGFVLEATVMWGGVIGWRYWVSGRGGTD